jgi:N-acetylmuramoyl-L-alanine amidase
MSTVDYARAQWVGSPNFSRGRSGRQPIAIVMHIAQGSRAGVVSWFNNRAANASSHYLVCRNGDVLQFVREADTAWTNGIDFQKGYDAYRSDRGVPWVDDCWKSRIDPNRLTITVEHEGNSGEQLPEPEIQASIDLTRDILSRYNWPTDDPHRIIGHYVTDSVNRAFCPGPAFPWDRFRSLSGGKSPDAGSAPSNPAELRLYAEWVLESLANGDTEVRGVIGRQRFTDHLKAIGADHTNPGRYGWPA